MPDGRFVFKDGFNPVPKKPRATKKVPSTWGMHKEILREKFLVEGLTVKEIARYMKETFNFNATDRQYNYRFQQWTFSKKQHPPQRFSPSANNIPVEHSQHSGNTSTFLEEGCEVTSNYHSQVSTSTETHTSIEELRSDTPNSLPSLLHDHESSVGDDCSVSARTPLSLSPTTPTGFDRSTRLVVRTGICHSDPAENINIESTTLFDSNLGALSTHLTLPIRRQSQRAHGELRPRPRGVLIEHDDASTSDWLSHLADMNQQAVEGHNHAQERCTEDVKSRITWLGSVLESEDEAVSDRTISNKPDNPNLNSQSPRIDSVQVWESGESVLAPEDLIVVQNGTIDQLRPHRDSASTNADQEMQDVCDFVSAAMTLIDNHHDMTPVDIPLSSLSIRELCFTTVSLVPNPRTSVIQLEDVAAIIISQTNVSQLQTSDFEIFIRLCDFLFAAYLYEDCFKVSYLGWKLLQGAPSPLYSDSRIWHFMALNLIRSSCRPEHLEMVANIIRQPAAYEDSMASIGKSDHALWYAHLGDLLSRCSLQKKPGEAAINVWNTLQPILKTHDCILAVHVNSCTVKSTLEQAQRQEPDGAYISQLNDIVEDASNHLTDNPNATFVRMALRQVLTWCRDLLQKQQFGESINTVEESHWNTTANEGHQEVIELEKTLCHLYLCQCYWKLGRLDDSPNTDAGIISAFEDLQHTTKMSPEIVLRAIVELSARSAQEPQTKFTQSTMPERYQEYIHNFWNHTAITPIIAFRGDQLFDIAALFDHYIWPGHPHPPKHVSPTARSNTVREMCIQGGLSGLETSNSRNLDTVVSWLRGNETFTNAAILSRSTRSSQMSIDGINFRNTFKRDSRTSRRSNASSMRAYITACEDPYYEGENGRKLSRQYYGASHSARYAHSRTHSAGSSQRTSDCMSFCGGSEPGKD